MSKRHDGRELTDLRPHQYVLDYAPSAEGSVLIHSGATRVLCAASVDDRPPTWLNEPGKGWVTAEYSMLPRSTVVRSRRDQTRTAGRTHEIQRLIGRSLRAVTDLKALASHSIILDCDVIHADAGTRTAAITGGWIALAVACSRLHRLGKIPRFPLTDQVAAVSLGILDSRVYLDLDFEEDRRAGVDMNLVMTGSGRLVEVQGTAESQTFDQDQLQEMIRLGFAGIQQLFVMQRQALADKGISWPPS